MPFTAGQIPTADELNATAYARLAADVSKSSSTTMTSITGLSFALAANAEYLLDGMLSYYCLDGVDAAFAFTGPTGMTVSWSLAGLHWSAADVYGDVTQLSQEAVGDATFVTLNSETSNALACRPGGYFKTGATSGTLQMRYAQANSNATALQIKRGSWLRLYRYA